MPCARSSPGRSNLERPGRVFWADDLFAVEERARRLHRLELCLEFDDPPARPGELVGFVALDSSLSAGVDECLVLPAIKRCGRNAELDREHLDALASEQPPTRVIPELRWIAEPRLHLRRIRARLSCKWINFWDSGQPGPVNGVQATRRRREWDSNPRCPRGHNGFRDRPIRPLSHPSGREVSRGRRDGLRRSPAAVSRPAQRSRRGQRRSHG